MSADTALKARRVSLDDFEEMLTDMPENGRWELIDGRVIKGMVGARAGHHQMIRKLDYRLRRHFERTGRPCMTFSETFYLRNDALDIQALPDLMVHCGPLPPEATFISDPIAIIEVLSPGTETRDRTIKSRNYRLLRSLQHYAMIDRDTMCVETYDRVASESGWLIGELTKPGDKLKLSVLDFEISLSEIYDGVLS